MASEDPKIAVGTPGALEGIHKHWSGSVIDNCAVCGQFLSPNGLAMNGIAIVSYNLNNTQYYFTCTMP